MSTVSIFSSMPFSVENENETELIMLELKYFDIVTSVDCIVTSLNIPISFFTRQPIRYSAPLGNKFCGKETVT